MRLIKYFLFIIIVALALSALATAYYNRGLKYSAVDFYGKMNAARKDKSDLVIMGSSRALKQLDPAIFQQVTGLRTFNYGVNSASVKSCYNMLKYILSYQNEVKVVLMNVDYFMFDIEKDPYKDAYYFPYENKMGSYLKDEKPNYLHKMKFFDVVLYDDYAKYAAIDGWMRPDRKIDGLYRGYYPDTSTSAFKNPDKKFLKSRNEAFSEQGIEALDKVMDLCQEKGIRLVLVVAPYFSGYAPIKYIKNYTYILSRVEELANNRSVSYYDLSNMPMADDISNFYNVNHLNNKGALLYSRILADTLKLRYK